MAKEEYKMIEIVNANELDNELDLDNETVDQICSLLVPAFQASNIGDSCNSFEFQHLWRSLQQNNGLPAILFLLRDGNKIFGLLGGVTFDDPLTGLRYAAEVVWRVSPEAGGQGWGLKLLQRFEWWAGSQGCKRIVLHGSTKEEVALCQKIGPLGYNPYQIEYVKEIK